MVRVISAVKPLPSYALSPRKAGYLTHTPHHSVAHLYLPWEVPRYVHLCTWQSTGQGVNDQHIALPEGWKSKTMCFLGDEHTPK